MKSITARKRRKCDTSAMKEPRRHEWIAERCKDLNKSQAGLAKAMGISAPALSSVIKGVRRVQIKEAKALSTYLQLSSADVWNNLDVQPVDSAPSSGSGEYDTQGDDENAVKGQGMTMTSRQIHFLRNRIKNMLRPLGAEHAADLVDEVLVELAAEEEASADPRERA